MKKVVLLFLLIFLMINGFSEVTDSYGLTVAGGAAYVFKSIGFLQALYEEGFVPDEFVGTSMGSIALYYMAQVMNLKKFITYSEK